jgi:hypothetical protein
MEWIQANLLWGLVGLFVPMAIHLWNGKRGKVIAWAATAWLIPKESQSSKSLRLDQVLLLIIRLLLWAILVFIAVGIFWKGYGGQSSSKIAHLVIPDSQVESEFRFELQQAKEKGELVYWLSEELPEMERVALPSGEFQASELQTYFDELPKDLDSIHIYAKGTLAEFDKNSYWISKEPVFHLSNIRLEPKGNSLDLGSGVYLGLNKEGILESNLENGELTPIDISSGIPVYLNLSKEKEDWVKKALAAISEVYGLTFPDTDSHQSRLIFVEKMLSKPHSDQLVLVTESTENPKSGNQIILSHPVDLNWEEIVDKGVLPELILDPLLEYLGLNPVLPQLTQNQLEDLFHTIPASKQAQIPNTTEFLLILLVSLFALERYLAYKKNL